MVRRLVPLHAVALDHNPDGPHHMGSIYYNTVDEELKFYDGSTWHAVSGAIEGILEHTHEYDGAIYAVADVNVINPGTIDGGGA
ncbi:MAG: hypothetical protein ACO3DP_01065 [Candidatus Nanopelagicaceae bacterium]